MQGIGGRGLHGGGNTGDDAVLHVQREAVGKQRRYRAVAEDAKLGIEVHSFHVPVGDDGRRGQFHRLWQVDATDSQLEVGDDERAAPGRIDDQLVGREGLGVEQAVGVVDRVGRVGGVDGSENARVVSSLHAIEDKYIGEIGYVIARVETNRVDLRPHLRIGVGKSEVDITRDRTHDPSLVGSPVHDPADIVAIGVDSRSIKRNSVADFLVVVGKI